MNSDTRPQMGDELLPCPFCGAKPHRGLSKLKHDQLHGDPYQEDQIWCPHGHARITHPAQGCAAQEWNVRASLPQPTAGSTGEADALRIILDKLNRAVSLIEGPPGLRLTESQRDGVMLVDSARTKINTLINRIASTPAQSGLVEVLAICTDHKARADVPKRANDPNSGIGKFF